MKKLCLLAGCLLPLLINTARADISFLFEGDLVTNSSNVALADGRVMFLIADTTNNGFALPTAGNFTTGNAWGSSLDDIILWTFAANGTGTSGQPGAMQIISPQLSTAVPGWTAGDRLAMFWFPTVNAVGNTGNLSSGDTYGMFGFGSVGSNSGNWTTPGDPASLYNLLFYTPSGTIFGPGNDVPAFGFIAVPEPATVGVLIGSAALGVAVWRRRRAVRPRHA